MSTRSPIAQAVAAIALDGYPEGTLVAGHDLGRHHRSMLIYRKNADGTWRAEAAPGGLVLEVRDLAERHDHLQAIGGGA